MKKFTGFAAMSVLAFTVVGCSDTMSPAAPTSAAADSGVSSGSDEAKGGRAALPTIAGTAVASAPEFTTLVAALSKAGLVDTFNGRDQYTVFAPTNAAFDAAAAALLGPGKTGMDLVNALPVDKLTQVLVYIGAISILVLFAIMLTQTKSGPARLVFQTQWWAAAIAAVLLVVVLTAVVVSTDWGAGPPQESTTSDVARLLFDAYTLPFEAVSVLLLAAVIGGIFLAKRDPSRDEGAG